MNEIIKTYGLMIGAIVFLILSIMNNTSLIVRISTFVSGLLIGLATMFVVENHKKNQWGVKK